MKKELLELLIHKELTGIISVEEQQVLADWKSAREENKQEYTIIKAIWESATIDDTELVNVDMNAQLAKLMSNVESEQPKKNETKVVEMKPRRMSRFPFMKIAAGFILVIGAFLVVQNINITQDRALVESTQEGEVESIDMMDGSSILLNENANLTFFPHVKSERRLSLDGEAFFDVARDESKPFIIETPNAVIRVLGTSFKVTTENKKKTVVEVRHGKVQVTPKNGGQAVVLTKGQKVSLQKEFSPVQTFSDFTLSGFKGMLEFDDTKLSKVMQLLEQKFGKQINWNTQALADCQVNGQFDGKSLEDIMAILKTVFNFEEIVFEDAQITMTGGTCK